MPEQRRRVNRRPVRGTRRVSRRRRTTTNKSAVSVVIKSITLKSRHNKEEVYPIKLSDIISRANVGTDADIRAQSYTLSVSIATGNDLSTVTSNIGHSGPWVRRGQSAIDNFNQQSQEHDFKRSKTVIFRRNLPASEREYLNPDTDDNYLNLRIRDPCGVIPGVTIKLECRFRLSRPRPSTTFLEGSEPAADLYEDQDVDSATSSGQPQPPSNLQDVPSQIIIEGSMFATYIYKATGKTSPIKYTVTNGSKGFTVTAAGTLNIVGEFNAGQQSTLPANLQSNYTKQGFEGTIAYGSI